MHEPNAVIPSADVGIAGTEADGVLQERDYLFDGPCVELAPANGRQCVYMVAVEGNHRLVFGDGLSRSVLCSKYLAFGEVRMRVARRCCYGLRGQLFGAGNI